MSHAHAADNFQNSAFYGMPVSAVGEQWCVSSSSVLANVPIPERSRFDYAGQAFAHSPDSGASAQNHPS